MPAERRRKQHARRIPGYTPEPETAEELNVSVRTLRKWRQLRIGPPYIEVGRQIHYGDESRAAWLKSREVRPVRELSSA
jgi:hypothetical protein